jgi:SAM-dependent methyltransferase
MEPALSERVVEPTFRHEALALGHEPPSRYLERCQRDVDDLWRFLPTSCTSFLDIGCGLGGHAALLGQRLGPQVTAHLLDGAEPRAFRPKDDVTWRPGMTPWTDVYETQRTLLRNGVPRAIAWTPLKADEVGQIRVDLILSIRACGYLFPVETYLDLMRRSLRVGGRLIVDLREGTRGGTVLGHYFRGIESWNPAAGSSGGQVLNMDHYPRPPALTRVRRTVWEAE